MQISITIDKRQIRELKRELGDVATKRLPREQEIIINKTANDVHRKLGDAKTGIRSELSVTSPEAKKAIDKRRASRTRLSATITVRKEKRIPLRAFKHRDLKRGVSYKTSPKTGTRKILDAFIPRPGGHIFRRHSSSRYPIATLMGASPWGAVAKRGIKPRMVRFGEARLRKELDRRIARAVKKRQGVI